MGFKQVGESSNRLYGPRCLLVCGYTIEEREAIQRFFAETTVDQIPVVFSTAADRTVLVKELTKRGHRSGADQACALERAIIMCGVTEKELHELMARYKTTGLPRPLWATLTPTSETWTIEALVAELASEHRQMPH